MPTDFTQPIKQIIFKAKEKLVQHNYTSQTNNSLTKAEITAYNRHRKYGPKPKLCYAPYKSLYLNADGKITACCKNNIDYLGQIQEQSLLDIWKSTQTKSLQEKISNNDLSNGCSFCEKQIKAKNYSAAEAHYFDYVFEKTNHEFPTEITFDISNICNLKCVMCNGRNSALIRAEREGLPPIENPYNNAFFEELKLFLPHLKIARFQGGEPFLIPNYTDVMEFLIEKNPKCKIYLQTNGTIFNQKVKKIIAALQVHLSISIDSLKEHNFNSIRQNGQLKRVIENFKKFNEISKNKKQKININTCLMNNNWQDIPDLISFAEQYNCSINVLPVETPHYYNLNTLNSNKLNEVIAFYQSFDNKFKNQYYNNVLSQVTSYIKSSFTYQEKFKAEIERVLKNNSVENLKQLVETELQLTKDEVSNQTALINEINMLLNQIEEENKKRLFAILYVIINNNKGNNADNVTTSERLVNYRIYISEFSRRLFQPDYFFNSINR